MRKEGRSRPVSMFSMSVNGFFGEYYKAEGDEFRDSCMIAVGGSYEGFPFLRQIAQQFIEAGINVLIAAYHDEPGLPKNRKDQPVDIIEKAALWLKGQGYVKIGLWGFSMGGTLALLSASMFPGLISAVVAISPTEMVMQAEEKGRPIEGSTFSYKGTPLAHADYALQGRAWRKNYVKALLQHKEPYLRDLMLSSYISNGNSEAIIAIWKINGPVLILGGGMDSITPDKETIRSMALRLADHDFPHYRESHIYPHLGHYVLPVRIGNAGRYLCERRFPAECEEERRQSWTDTLTFLRTYWK